MKKAFWGVLVLVSVSISVSISTVAFAEHDTNLFPPKKADKTKATQPGKVSLSEPAFMAKIKASNVTLKWAAVESADAYHVQVATDPNFKWLVANENMHKNTSFDVTGLEKGKHYYWRVAAEKSDNDPSYFKGWFSTSMFETL